MSDTPRVLIISQDARQYASLIAADGLPETDMQTASDSEQARHFCAQAEILFGDPDLIVPVLDLCPKLRWVQSSWAGIKPFVDADRRDYQLTGVQGIFGAPMSEYVAAWLLGLERNIPARYRAPHWDHSPEPGLQGKLAGIMGTGSIGSHVAKTCVALGIKTRGLNSDGRDIDGFEQCFGSDELAEFATGLDYLVGLLPETPESDNLIDADLLSRLNPGAIVINAGRANCLVEQDLVDALESGQIGHAVLDVLRQEPLPAGDALWAAQNLTITSHTAAPTRADSIVKLFRDNYQRYLDGQPLKYRIDFDKGY
jgi:phosphoglycerate dehydrogenase-like enzyme